MTYDIKEIILQTVEKINFLIYFRNNKHYILKTRIKTYVEFVYTTITISIIKRIVKKFFWSHIMETLKLNCLSYVSR